MLIHSLADQQCRKKYFEGKHDEADAQELNLCNAVHSWMSNQ